MDVIKIGLDFGTHQTKICVQRKPDEGHGEPVYEFFQFSDLQGNKSYFLPSVVQINDDDTLSYGFIDVSKKKPEPEPQEEEGPKLKEEYDVAEKAEELYDKYATSSNVPEDMYVLSEMLQEHLRTVKDYNSKILEEHNDKPVNREPIYSFRYFKQATFIGGDWVRETTIDNRTLCIWYLAYVIFLLEEKYGQNFTINMGIPADDSTYGTKRQLAVELLASAYYLVEEVYGSNNIQAFLSEKYTDLLAKTKEFHYSKALVDEYLMNIFPEAYAGLIALTSRGKLPTGMSLTADIGGGTTDISFFTIEEGNPTIYKYWSLDRGLNYIASQSGFDYFDGEFTTKINYDIVGKYNRKKIEIVSLLIKDLKRKIQSETDIPVQRLKDALNDRILVYSGGGSTYQFLTCPLDPFSDVRVVDSSVWKEENVKDKSSVSKLSVLLTTSYGLSVCEKDEDVKLKSYSSLFAHLPKKEEHYVREIDKDVC